MPPPGPTATTTFLFTDIEGSTRQWEVAPEMHRRVEAHFVALRTAIEGAGGRIFATMGDGVAAAFRSADAALRAAVDAQQQMPPLGLAVRMGIHTGEAEPVGEDFRGRPVNRAARIMAAGHGGQILLSDVTAALLRTSETPAELVDLGRRRLRDLAEPERLWQVRHPALSPVPGDVRSLDRDAPRLPVPRSSLVGRDQDVEHVVSLMQQHRIVTLTGVGGVGKTRLALHAAETLLDRFADVWFVDLAAAREPGDVADAVARTVGATAFTDAIAAARSLISGEPTLLVVDNCEHVLNAAAAVVDALVATVPEALGARDQSGAAARRRRARRRGPDARSAHHGGRAVQATGDGRRCRSACRPRRDRRGALLAPRWHPPRHRAGRGAGGDARSGGHRRHHGRDARPARGP